MPISSLRGPEEAREGGGEGSKRQKRLGATLQTVSAYMVRQPYPSEIIVVDDGTQDGDAECGGPVLRRDPPVRVLQNGRNRGKGFSVRQGFLHARGTYLLLSDADLSTSIEEVENLLAALHMPSDIAL